MTLSHKIYKSQFLINEEKVVMIEDTIDTPIVQSAPLEAVSNPASGAIDINQDAPPLTIGDQLNIEVMKSEAQRLRAEADQIVQAAKAEADKIIANAKSEAIKIKNEMIDIAAQEVKTFQEQGYNDGFKMKENELLELITYMNNVLKQTQSDLKQSQMDFITEMEEKVRFFALDIAKKVLAKEIETDQLALSCLVLEVLEDVKKDAKVSIEVSNQAKTLIERLKSEIANNDELDSSKIQINGIVADPDTLLVEHDTGLIDASISTQISVLEDLFNKF